MGTRTQRELRQKKKKKKSIGQGKADGYESGRLRNLEIAQQELGRAQLVTLEPGELSETLCLCSGSLRLGTLLLLSGPSASRTTPFLIRALA